MTKRQSSLDTALLLIELLKRIPKNWYITAQQLQQQLADMGMDRNIHTIQRHLKTLVESGHYAIDMDTRSKPYGYRWSKAAGGFTVNSLSVQESLILRMSHEYLQNLLPSSVMDSMSGFFEEADRNICQSLESKKESDWLSKVVVASETQPLLPPELKPGVFNEVSSALYKNLWLDVVYKNAQGSVKEKSVMPLGLVQQGARLYLVCRFRGYNNERALALHRLQSARVTTLIFERPKNFDLQQFSHDGRLTFGNGEKVRLSFSIEKDAGLHLLESRLSEDQIHTETDDCYEISATVVQSKRLTWWLEGFGDKVQGISIQSLIPGNDSLN